MAIRIRVTKGNIIALCAAKSKSKKGDIYLDDNVHHALTEKFYKDFKSEGIIKEGVLKQLICDHCGRSEDDSLEVRETWINMTILEKLPLSNNPDYIKEIVNAKIKRDLCSDCLNKILHISDEYLWNNILKEAINGEVKQ